VVAGILGLLAGALIGLAVGNNGKTVTEAQRAGQPAITRTVTQPAPVAQPKVEVHTNTVTVTASTPSPASAESEARIRELQTNLRTAEKENEELKRQLEGRPAP
jgi:cell division septation protein DedD